MNWVDYASSAATPYYLYAISNNIGGNGYE